MILRPFAYASLLTLLAPPARSQPPSPPPAFEIADVHSSVRSQFPLVIPGALHGDRYIIRQRTLAQLIATAYDLDATEIFGGPAWLEHDRFDIVAKAPPSTPSATLNLMLQALLADRFHLVVHIGSKPMPAFILSAANAKPKLKPTDGSRDSICENTSPPPDPAGSVQPTSIACHNTTLEDFARRIHGMAAGYLPNPVVDATGLKDAFDFDLRWTSFGDLQKAGPNAITVFDAVDKQLGLKLDLQTAPRPILIVDSANQKPTPNRPDLDAVFPPPPPPEFDVAVIRPSKADSNNANADIGGTRVNVTNMTLKFLILFAWNLSLNDDEVLVGAPKWLTSDRFDMQAEALPPALPHSPKPPPFDPEELRAMLRKLLMDRFKLQVHTELRPREGYTLLAVNPKLKPADPSTRTLCKEGPGPDGKDSRGASPILDRLIYCRNVSMAQFADDLQTLASGYIFSPVVDATGIAGGWDFGLSFSSAWQLSSGADAADAGISDPSGAISLFDAVNKQLGLKLEKQKRPLPVLVIDHIEQKPTEN